MNVNSVAFTRFMRATFVIAAALTAGLSLPESASASIPAFRPEGAWVLDLGDRADGMVLSAREETGPVLIAKGRGRGRGRGGHDGFDDSGHGSRHSGHHDGFDDNFDDHGRHGHGFDDFGFDDHGNHGLHHDVFDDDGFDDVF